LLVVRLGFVGDVFPGPGGLRLSPGVTEHLRSFDLLVANLESPLTSRPEPAVRKGTVLRSSPESVSLLAAMGVDVAGLANNHMFDFGPDGFADTVAALDAAGIRWVGAGADVREARRPLQVSVGDTSVGFVAYSAPQIETTVAGASSAGCAPASWPEMEAGVAEAARTADVVVVMVHWGLTGYELPTPDHRRACRDLVAAGATLVIGTHPHVVQGIAAVGGGLIAHSLGDFAFYPEIPSGRRINQYRARQTGCILGVEFDGHSVASHDVFLTRQRGSAVAVETSRRRSAAVARSSARIAVGSATYPATWRRYVLRRTVTRAVKRLAPWKWRTIRPGTIKGVGVALRELRRR
jgi:poly-gamma-glutamate capsule biosynthesis protein CapA/YwtB (metallophosphatase superfamily)